MKRLSPQQLQRLQQMYAAAQQAHQSGMHDQAERLYRDILASAPEAWDVCHALGMLFATTGRPAEAAQQFRRLVKAHPTHASAHANLASALAESELYDEAITEFRRALTLDESMNGARIALAATFRKAGKPEEAITIYKMALDRDKTNHQAFNGLGLAYRDVDDLPRALEGFEHAVGVAPNVPEYRLNFGVTLRKYDLLQLSVEQLYEAVKLRPDWLDAVVLLAESLQEQRRFDEARECYERALQLSPEKPELNERLAYVYLDMDDAEDSLRLFNQVLEKSGKRFMAALGRGRSLMLAGKTDVASATFEQYVADYPDDAIGYAWLAQSRKFKLEDGVIPKMRMLADQLDDEEKPAIAVNFGLGKIYDDIKQWDDAFKYYAKGNSLRNREYNFQPQAEADYFTLMMETFTREFIDAHSELGSESDQPVLIVGMPRSGTTLTEQIISSHPQVIGAGEVIFWGRAPNAVPYLMQSDTPWPTCMAEMKLSHAQEVSRHYLDLLHKIAGPGTSPARITDKMPHNFVQLGLIAMLFPKARFIHCRRDVMDNCLSIFFQNFGGNHPYAYDLSNIGHHYKQYERLMAYWHTVLPGRIMDISYEDTVADPEYWSRKLIEHVGLEWDDACLAPHKLERNVKTASHWQVRQPIYKTSVQRWKHYVQHLGPLKEALGYQG